MKKLRQSDLYFVYAIKEYPKNIDDKPIFHKKKISREHSSRTERVGLSLEMLVFHIRLMPLNGKGQIGIEKN